jgi:ABC-type nickel/cobalt efflux system permease component RcnA
VSHKGWDALGGHGHVRNRFSAKRGPGTRIDADGNGAFISVAALASCLGMVHALTPRHGKVVLFAYFLGRKARPWAGLLAAAQIACLHVGIAIVLVRAIGGCAA